jgi:hypothetical protein
MANKDHAFSVQVAEWAKRTNHRIDVSVRNITLELFSGIIQATPVGQPPDVSPGRARGNWQTSVPGLWCSGPG